MCEGEERKRNMAEWRNTVVCTFDTTSPKITAYDIHEWIHDTLRIPEKAVNMILPVTSLNTDYKILVRILANHLRPILEEQLRTTQFCCVPGNSILEAVSVVRESISYAETTDTPLRVLALDFQNAFDRISHQYLFQILQRYGISSWFIDL